MPSNPAQQTAQAQQQNQQQAEQFLAQQRQQALGDWSSFFKSNPNPAAMWPGIAAPNFSGSPSAIGGGYIGGNGMLSGAFGPWSPSGPGGTATLPAPPPQMGGGKGKGAKIGSNNSPPVPTPPGGQGNWGGGGWRGHGAQ